MNFIILADKFKKGMKSKGCAGLIKASKRENIFQKQYKAIKKHNKNNKIIYVAGFDHERFVNFINKNPESYDIELYINKQYHSKGSFFSLSLAKHFLNKDCCVLGGQTVISNNFIKTHIKPKHSKLFIGNNKTRISCLYDDYVNHIGVDLPSGLHEIYILKKDVCSHLLEFFNDNNDSMFIFEVLNKLIDQGQKFSYSKPRKADICFLE